MQEKVEYNLIRVYLESNSEQPSSHQLKLLYHNVQTQHYRPLLDLGDYSKLILMRWEIARVNLKRNSWSTCKTCSPTCLVVGQS